MRFKNAWNTEYTTVYDVETYKDEFGKKKQRKVERKVVDKLGLKQNYRKIRHFERLMARTPLIKPAVDTETGRVIYGPPVK